MVPPHHSHQLVGLIDNGTAVAANGEQADVGVVVFCTGFDVAEPIYAQRVYGTDGRTLSQHWGDGEVLAHTLFAPDFPNMVAVNARHTGLGHNSLVHIIESQAQATIDWLNWASNHQRVEVTRDVMKKYEQHLRTQADGSA